MNRSLLKALFIYLHSATSFLMVWLIMLCGKGATAQTHIQVPMEHIQVTSLADTPEIKQSFRIADSLRKTDFNASIGVLREAYAASKAIGYAKGIFVAGNKLGEVLERAGRSTESLRWYLTVSPYRNRPENIGNVNMHYNNIGLAYSSLGNYEKAIGYYNKALESLGQKWIRANGIDSITVYNNIGIVWARVEEYSYAIATFKKVAQIAISKQNTGRQGLAYMNMGECYYRMGQWDSAEYYYTRSMQYRGDAFSEVAPLTNLAMVYKEKGQYAKALEYLNNALHVIAANPILSYEVEHTHAALGDVYLSMKEYSKAKPLLVSAFYKMQAMGHQEMILLWEPKVAEVYAATGQYRQAYLHGHHYSRLRDSIYKQEKARSLEVWMNAQLAEKDKAMLSQKLHIAGQETQLQRKNIWIGGSVLGALLLLSVSIAIVRGYRHRQVIQQSLISQLQQRQEIDELKAQVRGEEQERQRIARELHDNIASQLWAIKLNVDSMKQGSSTEDKQLSSIYQQLNDATQDIRRTAHNLMPDLLLEEGLATALASVCEKIRKNTPLEVDFLEYGIVPAMDKEIELSIYRMVQELIQNVMKHAKDATHLLVQLSCAGTLLNITVEDNGTEFAAKEDGVGLQQIRKRTLALKGVFDLQSVQGKGTTAYLEFDLQHLL